MDLKKSLRNLIIIGSATIGTMHCINTLIYESSKKTNHLSGTDNSYYDSHFGRISYKTYGKGTPLLLLHDLDVCSSSYEWSKVTGELSKNHTVYAIDLLGCGCSDKSNLIYTNYLYVQLVHAFIMDIIKEPTDIIATGYSAVLAVMSSVQNTTMINNIILVNPKSTILSVKPFQKCANCIKYLFATPVIGRFIYNMCVNKDKVLKNFQQKYYYNLEKISEDAIMTYFESSQKENTKGKHLYSSLLCGFLNYNISGSLQKIENKLAIIVGGSDPESINNAKEYQNYLPDIEIKEIKQTKYLPQLESPEEFIETAEQLL